MEITCLCGIDNEGNINDGIICRVCEGQLAGMIEKWNIEQALMEEYENNLEKF